MKTDNPGSPLFSALRTGKTSRGLMIGAMALGLAMQSSPAAPFQVKAVPIFRQQWWQQSDASFAKIHAGMATGSSLADQSTVAWMLFARLNQPVATGGGHVNSMWETWKSNAETFSSSTSQLKVLSGARRTLHLQKTKASRMAAHLSMNLVEPSGAGEEVTRNKESYDYIVGKGLNTVNGVWAYLGQPNAKVDLPIGAVETKADWVKGAKAGAYQYVDTSKSPAVTYSLVGLHIMAKMAPTPADPFHSETPSWFWTTFEYQGNPGLANAQSLLTYKDAITPAASLKLLTNAGLGSSPFVNYRCNGTQIRYSDAAHPKILMGNTTMEAFAGVPKGKAPAVWTAWNTSCHTCHGEASGNAANKTTYPFQVLTGKLTNPLFNTMTSLDFVWSIPFQLNLPPN